jgi:hypothetical protein
MHTVRPDYEGVRANVGRDDRTALAAVLGALINAIE